MDDISNVQIERIVVFARLRCPGLGDVMQRNILFSLLQRRFPRAEVTLVVGADVAASLGEFLEHHTYSQDVLVCPAIGDDDAARWREFRRTLVGGRFQLCVVDPDSRGLGMREAANADIPVRMAVPTGGPDDVAITIPICPRPSVWGPPDLYSYAAAVAAAIGIDRAPRPGQVVPPLPYLRRDLPELDAEGPRVAVHPGGALHWNRRWPLVSYAEICRRVVAELGASLYLLGSREEREELDMLRNMVVDEHPVATVHVVADGELNRTINLLAGIDVFVGNDSAPAHCAAAMGTPSVVIYGPTGTEHLWSRVYPRHRGVSLRMPCQRIVHSAEQVASRRCEWGCVVPYSSPNAPYPKCLADIAVSDVWHALNAQLRLVDTSDGAPRDT